MNDSGKYNAGIPVRFVHQLFLLLRHHQFSQSLLVTSIFGILVVIGDYFSDETDGLSTAQMGSLSEWSNT